MTTTTATELATPRAGETIVESITVDGAELVATIRPLLATVPEAGWFTYLYADGVYVTLVVSATEQDARENADSLTTAVRSLYRLGWSRRPF